MEIPGAHNPVLQQVNQLWSILDDMSLDSPESYRTFIEKQLRDGADFYSPPQPDSCIQVAILGPKRGVLYINVCSWKRVPVPSSTEHPVPVCGGRLDTHTEGKEQYSVLDVAFSPDVVVRAHGDPREMEQLHLLAVSFAQQQHGLSLAQGYTTLTTACKGSTQGVKDRLVSPRQPQQPVPPPAQPSPAPSLLQQISSLRGDGGVALEGTDDPPAGRVTLDLGGGGQPARPGLIQVISSSESPLLRRPVHRLTLHSGTAATGDQGRPSSLELTIELPGVRSARECQLSISQDDVLLEVEDMYHLHLNLPKTVNEETATGAFNVRTHTLTLSVSVL
ncbi:PIH1 domain-containing protein 2 [Alosa pseudoharengus]|uniref:PIH1 domain-containing protein 2 n=1 Tax=Alosa pseudoharengus TaxID=34774 RepID=UPI003F8AD996